MFLLKKTLFGKDTTLMFSKELEKIQTLKNIIKQKIVEH